MQSQIILVTLISVIVAPKSQIDWSRSQSLLLQQFKSCTLRFVFLENSYSANQDILIFIKYYLESEQNSFILESRPMNENVSIIIPPPSKFQSTRQQTLKFIQCYTILYFSDQILDNLQNPTLQTILLSQIDYFRYTTVTLRNENPTSIVYISLKNSISETENRLYQYTAHIDVTSTFYVFSNRRIFLICSTCTFSNLLFEISHISHLSDQHWRHLHLTYGARIYVQDMLQPWDDTIPYTCELFPKPVSDMRYPETNSCFLRSMKTRLNVTAYLELGIQIGKQAFAPMGKQNVDFLFTRPQLTQSFECVSIGMLVTQYQFGTLINPYIHQMEGLSRPLDKTVWILLFISFVALCAYFRLVFRYVENRNGVRIQELQVLSTLLDQSDDRAGKCKNLSKRTGALLMMWMFIALLISNAYKGVLFSFLTTPAAPIVPMNLKEMVNSKYFLATISAQGKVGNVTSTAKGYINQIIEDLKNGIGTSSLPDYEALRSKMIFFDPILDVSSLFVPSFTQVDNILPAGVSPNHSVPAELIFFDGREKVKLFGEVSSLFSSNVFIMGDTFDLFTSRDQWVFERNTFLRLVFPYLQGVGESGIFARWQNWLNMIKDSKSIRYVRWKLSCYSKYTKVSNEHNILAYVLFKPYTARGDNSEPKPISIEFFNMLGKLFSYCVIVCCVVCALEIVSHKWSKHFGRHDTFNSNGVIIITVR